MGYLLRIDDRLIHGQVVVGWGTKLDPDMIILADDDIASDEEQSSLFLMGVPFHMEGKVLSFKETTALLKDQKSLKCIIVVNSPESILALIDHGFKVTEVNIGGMHSKDGKFEITHYVYCNSKDIENIKKINDRGIKIFIQDLPGEKIYTYDNIIQKWKRNEKNY